MNTAPRLPLRHRLVSRYYRAAEHPGKLRLLGWLKRLLGVELVQAEIVPGVHMELDPADYVQREILFHGGYELPTLARFDLLLRDAAGFTDFGGHVGLYSLRAARALAPRGGRVFAIEPTVSNAQALLRNASLSGLRNLELCTAAFSDRPGILRMIAPHRDNTGGSRIGTAENVADDQREIALHVAVRPAAELAALIPPACLDLVKLDVEGHELRILLSLFSATPLRPRNILLEYLPDVFGNPSTEESASALRWLAAEGYELLTIDGQPFVSGGPLPDANLWLRRRGS